ncbi:FAD:protein FMN transferase [Roseibium sp. CAU 1637]|uniref:FAD:protein FMN transferase n=1 Tax=Roseibium limicola TaxID=2816037 RepID=A0A939EK20_9HYPH|nr:FAD:protein FMN transferase [Roseibium limicola]MBO0344080.1 FAD:protein FMN transferase [Roseibium limicola]
MRILSAALLTLSLVACSGEEPAKTVRLSGKTMGTTFNITALAVPSGVTEEKLSAEVEAVLADVNAKMSNWDKASEVSRFSASESTEPFKVSGDFVTVMRAANQVHELSDGKFDVTLGPLISLWGFGPRQPEDPVPQDAAIEEALAFVGQSKLLSLDETASTVTKSAPEVGINLSAIAKGFGIDAVAAKLKSLGIDSYMVEIGGDLVTAGENEKAEAWRIGIEKPEPGEKAIELIVPVMDKGLATSGDYRNFVEFEGKRYSHIIDPTTGRPITHWTTSVSVVTDNAMMADAWATAMLALGNEKGLEVAEEQGLAVYFISHDGSGTNGSYITQASTAFEALLNTK